ncbi:MAG: oxidoreductase [Candidatus Nanopelagicales bacterium]|jgi:NAD(P)-dependent dehydrogenase (short-subunit alcohol dehydrogenase family)
MGSWNENDIGDLTGTTAVVTGANSGVGFHTALALARHGADVIMACRDEARSQKPFNEVSAGATGDVELRTLDLADLDSVAQFATSLNTDLDKVDILVNNAGVMGGPRRSTAQGFELQMGTNHLGHFALVAQLWPLLTAATAPRVVSLSSLAARSGSLGADMTRDDLVDPQPYHPFPVYQNTKQATLLFSQELARRATAAKVPLVSVAAHPGVSSTNLFNRQLRERSLGFAVPIVDGFGKIVFQSPKAAANPSIRAATDTKVRTGGFVGPGSLGQIRGSAEIISVFGPGRDPKTAARLWELSEEITETSFPI